MVEKWQTVKQYFDLLKQFGTSDTHRFAVIEGNTGCNRSCNYCSVPNHYNAETELTVAKTCTTIDWLHDQGYRMLSYIGGEPLAPFKTKENISFARHTLDVVRYAKQKGMFVNVATNGDFVTPNKPDVIEALSDAGLDSLTFSLHSYTDQGLQHIIHGAKLAARYGIIPVIRTVFTKDNADIIPALAAHAARNGILFSIGLVQEKGGQFSTKPAESNVPSQTQQEAVFQSLIPLKKCGFIANSMSYLTQATGYYSNNWTCDSEQDAFIHIGAGGTVDVCSDVRTQLTIQAIESLHDDIWRNNKRVGVSNCGNCLYHCYFEAQNPDVVRDIPMIFVGAAIKAGLIKLTERLGRFAAAYAEKNATAVTWQLNWE